MYKDIKESVIRNFSFLKSYGFIDFYETQLAHEYHFKTKNDNVFIDIWFEVVYSSPIMIKIENYYIDFIELENTVLGRCGKQRSDKYDGINYKKLQQCYEDNGKLINEIYLKECSEILKRNLQVLNGNLEVLELNTKKELIKKEQLKIVKRIKDKIYTLEYEIVLDGISLGVAFEEFTSVDKLNCYLTEQKHIKNYKILDWNMEEI